MIAGAGRGYMTRLQPGFDREATNEIATRGTTDGGGRLAAIVSAVALVFSAYSLWETSLKQPDLRMFVPDVIQYTSPFNNSNFEAFQIPVTLANEGARTGTVLGIDLEVTDPRTNQTKRFYAHDLGNWSMERSRSRSFQPFAPMSLAGRSSRSESVLFYTKGDDEKPAQLVRELGPYRFKLRLREVPVDDFGWLDRWFPSTPTETTFEMELKFFDARAFNNGTLPMYSTGWRTAPAPVPTAAAPNATAPAPANPPAAEPPKQP
jgi:hypothetical protein